jgi:hypothetical protein
MERSIQSLLVKYGVALAFGVGQMQMRCQEQASSVCRGADANHAITS